MFDLNQASDNVSVNKYQVPGIFDNVRFKEAKLEATSKQGVPYIKLVTEGPNGEIGSSAKLFLSTTANQGKSKSAWSVTARNIVNFIKSTHNVDEETAKSMIDPSQIKSAEDLVKKLNAILVGRPFRAKFKGEQSTKTVDGKSYTNIYATLAQTESMSSETRMTYDPTRDIKVSDYVPAGSEATSVDNDPLPF